MKLELFLDELLEVDDDDTGSWLSPWYFLLVLVLMYISDSCFSFPEADEDEEDVADANEEDGGDDEDDGEAGVSETPSR